MIHAKIYNNNLTSLFKKVSKQAFDEMFIKVKTVGIKEFQLLDNPIYKLNDLPEIIINFDIFDKYYINLDTLYKQTNTYCYHNVKLIVKFNGMKYDITLAKMFRWCEDHNSCCVHFDKYDWEDNLDYYNNRDYQAFNTIITENTGCEINPLTFDIYELRK